MSEQQNVDLVKKLYGAFGKGDIETIVQNLADPLVWRFDAPSVIPYAGEYNTPDLRPFKYSHNLIQRKRV